MPSTSLYRVIGNIAHPKVLFVSLSLIGCESTLEPRPSVSVEPLEGVVHVMSGGMHSCAVTAESKVYCWGLNDRGQLGVSSSRHPLSSLALRVPIEQDVRAVTGGGSHSCAVDVRGDVWCWGDNSKSQLDSTDADEIGPVKIALSGAAESVAAGTSHTCAVMRAGGVECWGFNCSGQAGTKKPASCPEAGGNCTQDAAQVSGTANAVELCAGDNHTCSRNADGSIGCWGSFLITLSETTCGIAQCGTGQPLCTAEATEPFADLRVTAIGCGGTAACVATETGVDCWGDNRSGPLLEGSMPGERVHTVDGAQQSVQASNDFACALSAAGVVRCWGTNYFDPSKRARASRVPATVIKGIEDAQAITVGLGHACALEKDGTIRCWGSNAVGQLGHSNCENDDLCGAATVLKLKEDN
jgi:alpha-tubulin suppressor-like RCC1 family protein